MLRVLNHGEGSPRRTCESNTADEAMQCLSRVVSSCLREMRHGQDRNAGALGHLAQGFEDAADFAVLVTVGFPQIG